MGEIAEALRRQREEQESQRGLDPSGAPGFGGDQPEDAQTHPEAARPPRDSTFTDALARARDENHETEGVQDPEKPLLRLSEEATLGIGKVELHRHLALQVAAQLEERSAQTIAVVSALRDEGKTTVAMTLATALASLTSKRSVALVDLDMRNPSVARRLQLDGDVGVESFLQGKVSLDAIRISVESPLLDIYPSVVSQASAHELLARPSLIDLIAQLRERYQTVVIDTPPTLIVPDASMLIKRIDGCVAVARAGVSRARRIKEMMEMLPSGSVIGKILNSARLPNRDKYYYEYGYGTESTSKDEAGDTPD